MLTITKDEYNKVGQLLNVLQVQGQQNVLVLSDVLRILSNMKEVEDELQE
jgi:hypothetical protein